MEPVDHIRLFEQRRPALFGLAYRLLGSVAEAEDAMQELFLKWSAADNAALHNPAAWLTTACTRLCIDELRAARRQRTEYVGSWLPEPLHTVDADGPEGNVELASSLTTAFLLVLERLSPKERAAFLLHDIFEHSYEEIAEILQVQEAACRKLVSRARERIGQRHSRFDTPRDQQQRLLTAFRQAINTGDSDALAGLLSEQVTLTADGGGKATAVRSALHGKTDVLRFVLRGLRRFWQDSTLHPAMLNGTEGFILTHENAVYATVTFGFDEAGNADQIFIVRNPDKLAHLSGMPRTGAVS